MYENSYSCVLKLLLCMPVVVFLLLFSCGSRSAETTQSKSNNVPVPEGIEDVKLKRLIGQTLIVAIRWHEDGSPVYSLGKKELALLKDLQPGGVALFAANLDTVEQTRALVRQIQDACEIAPFIAIDEEGGRVSRLATGRAIKSTKIPSAARLSKAGTFGVSVAYGIIATELASLGVNMNFAPVADLGLSADSEVVGDRSFGADPLVVAQMVDASVRALQGKKILAVLKHYPGHGRAGGDSHLGTQSVNASWSVLVRADLIPFMAAINARVGAVMTAHIEYPQIEPSQIPVSMSEILLRDKLRGTLGFRGLIITDALDMGGITDVSGPEEAAVKSLAAGVDMLLCPERALSIRNALVKALKERKLEYPRIKESFELIQSYKKDFGILDVKVNLSDNKAARKVIGSPQHRDALQVALSTK